MKRMKKATDFRFASMGIFCACLIVVLHSGVSPESGSLSWYVETMVRACCRIAVPWFFFAAGYWLARHVGENGWWKREVSKRIRSLLVPMWVWSLLGFGLTLCVGFAMKIAGYHLQQGDGLPDFGWQTALTVVGLNFWVNMGPLWFVRTLFAFVCISPLMAWGGKGMSLVRLLALALVYGLSAFALPKGCESWTFFEYGFSLRGLAYFAAGIHLQRYPIDIPHKRGLAWLALVCAGALLYLEIAIPRMSAGLDLIFVPVAMYAAFYLLGDLRGAEHSFQIYLMHGLFLTVFSCGLGLFGIRTTSLQSLWWHLGRATFAIGGSIVAATALRRWFPRVANVAFGGR